MLPSFSTFFQALHNCKPYEWQELAANEFCEGKLLESLSMPTGVGKSKILDIWFYSLCHNLSSGQRRHIPLRFFYTVDRRLLIDDVNESAKKLLAKLKTPELKAFAQVIHDKLDVDTALIVGHMRGGLDRGTSNHWIASGYLPNMPAVVSTSIDQLGSRLLGRGYGVSPRARSIHAALVANDSFVCVDESHLAEALINTMKDMKGSSKLTEHLPSHIMTMTATPSSGGYTYDISKDPALRARLSAKRLVRVVRLPNKASVDEAFVNEATKAIDNKNPKAILVVRNTVAGARSVFHKLSKKNQKGEFDLVLITGRIRQYDRAKLLQYISPLLSGRDRSALQRNIIVVATQTVEVGADLDFDHGITDQAPLDSLRQRNGRIDRMGFVGYSEFVIICPPDDGETSAPKPDPVYGEVAFRTFQFLSGIAKDGIIEDFGAVQNRSDLHAIRPSLARLTPQVVDVLYHTYPDVPVDLDAYLHGVRDKSTDFTLIYRRDVPVNLKPSKKHGESCKKWLGMIPVSPLERLSLPISALYTSPEMCDTDGVFVGGRNSTPSKSQLDWLNSTFCVRRSDWKIIPLREVRAGDEIYVSTKFGKYDRFGWNPQSDQEVDDLYDETQSISCRIHPMWVSDFDIKKVQDKDGIVNKNLLRKVVKKLGKPKWRSNIVQILKSTHTMRLTPDGCGLYIYKTPERKKSSALLLESHNQDVGERSMRIAIALGLPQEIVEDLGLAGHNHDIGKSDPRFQQTLHSPNPFNGKYLAKSRGTQPTYHYPRGWRHEAQSLCMFVDNGLEKHAHDARLVRHLIASHHGFFRAFCPVLLDNSFVPYNYGTLHNKRSYFKLLRDADWSDFATLNDQYGGWGVAFLESIIRLSDHKESAK